MVLNDLQVQDYIQEYRETVTGNNQSDSVESEKVIVLLAEKHGWTEDGASILTHLARGYGSFILSHALALAIVLGQEDGRLEL